MNKTLPIIIFSIYLFLAFNTPVLASEIGGIMGTGYIGTRTITNPSPSNMQTEVTEGLISLGSTSPTNTPSFTFNTNFILKDGDAVVTFPADTIVTKTGGGNIDLTSFSTSNNTLEIQNEVSNSVGAIKIGIPNINLTFSKAITVTIPVGTAYNGQTLTAYYRSEGSTIWLVETTCIVTNGNCTFQTTHATTFSARGNTTTSSNSNSSSSTNNNSPSSCDSSKPSSVPDLFQISANSTSAKLFFTPISNTTSFYFSFSTKPKAEEFGAQATLSREGVQNFTVNLLKPNTTYYFKVRGQNGCMPGDWSNIVKIKTQLKGVTKKFTFYKNTSLFKKVISKVVSIINTPTEVVAQPIIAVPTVTKVVVLPIKKTCFLWWCN